jgi:ArsR family metal-binding transcriptional regulator
MPSSDRLIRDYDLELCSPPCHPGAETWTARAGLHTDIGELLPLLNACLEDADYDQAAGVLLWKQEGHRYAFRAREIKAGPVRDREEAHRLAEKVVSLMNDVWSRRDQIEPSYHRRTVPDLMSIYRLLPRTNCRECGFATCMAFAAALRRRRTTLACCPVLSSPDREESRAALAAMAGVGER